MYSGHFSQRAKNLIRPLRDLMVCNLRILSIKQLPFCATFYPKWGHNKLKAKERCCKVKRVFTIKIINFIFW